MKTIRTGKVGARVLNSIMLGVYFPNMTDEDLKAMFAYLRTIAPAEHQVDNTESPTYCRRCGQTQGIGNLNY